MLTDSRKDKLLELLQEGIPCAHRPFQALAEQLESTEQRCIEAVMQLRAEGEITAIAADFDLRAYGYQGCLVAMQAPAESAQKAARAVHDYPGLAYCVQRYDPFNLWLSIYVPPSESLDHVVEALHILAGSEETLMLPALRIFKVTSGVGSEGQERQLALHHQAALPYERTPLSTALTEEDVRLIRALQQELPLVEMPFAVIANEAQVSEEALFAWMSRARKSGLLAHYGARVIPRHLAAHLMVVWQVPLDRIESVAEAMARFREVRFCDQRPIYEHWPYSLFTLIEAPSEQKCVEMLARLEKHIGTYAHKNLFHVAEYKNKPVRFFDAAHEGWWQESGMPALSSDG